LQRRVPAHDGGDVPTLSARVLAVEHEAIVEAIRRFLPAQATMS
jgi:folate-dependent phosphoribosylglycinamide formyltransferase PurN